MGALPWKNPNYSLVLQAKDEAVCSWEWVIQAENVCGGIWEGYLG